MSVDEQTFERKRLKMLTGNGSTNRRRRWRFTPSEGLKIAGDRLFVRSGTPYGGPLLAVDSRMYKSHQRYD